MNRSINNDSEAERCAPLRLSPPLFLPLALVVAIGGCADMSSKKDGESNKLIDANAPLASSAARLASDEIEADEVADAEAITFRALNSWSICRQHQTRSDLLGMPSHSVSRTLP